MICADAVAVSGSASGVVSWQSSASQPADLTSCDAVIFTGADSAGFPLFSLPSSTDLGTFWVLGFSLVVVSFMAAWGCGAILGMLDKH